MDLTNYEQFCLTNGVNFTAVRGFGAKRQRKDFSTFEEAKEYGETFNDKRTMIYAVTDMGQSAHIVNV